MATAIVVTRHYGWAISNNLSRLRPRNDPLEAGTLIAVEGALSSFSVALGTSLLLVLLFLFTNSFSQSFLHAFLISTRRIYGLEPIVEARLAAMTGVQRYNERWRCKSLCRASFGQITRGNSRVKVKGKSQP